MAFNKVISFASALMIFVPLQLQAVTCINVFTGAISVSAQGNNVSIARKVNLPSDPGSDPKIQTRLTSFRTQAPVVALKSTDVHETTSYSETSSTEVTRPGVVAFDGAGALYLHNLISGETKSLRNVRVKNGDIELTVNQIKDQNLLLPSESIATSVQLQLSKDGTFESLQVRYQSTGGYEVTAETLPQFIPKLK